MRDSLYSLFRWLARCPLVLILCTPSSSVTLAPSRAASTPVEILWDTAGVPHIYGKTVRDTFYGFGWAQARSHANLLLKLYGQSRGRAAEYWGESYLESDRWVRVTGIPERAEDWYNQQTPAFRNQLDAFAQGINDYARTHPKVIAADRKRVLPIRGADVLAHLQHQLHFTFVVDPRAVLTLQPQPQAQSLPLPRSSLGSNAWAIAPSRSTNGNALLLANPHTPWADRFRWYEAHLNAPGYNLYGASFIGVPVLNLGFNDHLGWTHTVNTHDGWDAYDLKVQQNSYVWDNRLRPLETQTQTLKVQQADGSIRTQPLEIQRSIHGPIIHRSGERAIALRVVGLDRPRALEQWWNMGKAQTLQDFEAALQDIQIPMFSILYADRAGHILHLFNGLIPVRSRGTFADWQGLIPGHTSTTLWSKTHPYQDLPRVLDPPSGWLQNANDPPWSTTLPQPLDPQKYPPYFAPPGPISLRAQRSIQLLTTDPKLSLETMVAYKHSTRMALADRLLDDLIPAAQQSGNALARQAAAVLQRWDRHANAESRGAVLFNNWFEAMDSDTLFARPWTPSSPLTTPDGLADPKAAVHTLERVARTLRDRSGSLDIAWGNVFRFRSPTENRPANGGYGDLGIFRTIDFEADDARGYRAVGGDSFIAAIEFSNPVSAKVSLGYGNATQPDASGSSTQFADMERQSLRTALRSRSDIEQHLTLSERLNPQF